jgi:3-dehydroquinate dehydratase-1
MGQSWIVAIRQPFLMQPDCEKLFSAAVNNATRFVDVGFDLLSNPIALNCIEKARNSRIKLMLSYHNFESTPSFEELKHICSEMSLAGADALKIACMANSESDNVAVMKLYDHFENITAFCMGEHGRNSRIRALKNGLKLTYVSPNNGPATAPGQYSFSEMCAIAETAFEKEEENE